MRLSATALACCALLAGCAYNSDAPRPTPSGFLGGTPEYRSLEQSNADPDVWSWHAPGRSLGEFSKVLVPPIEVWPASATKLRREVPPQAYELAEFFRAELVRVVGPAYPIVTRPGPGVLAMRAAITNIEPAVPLMNIDPASRYHKGGAGGARMEAELIDAGSGDLIGRVMTHRRADDQLMIAGMQEWEHSRMVVTHWANVLRERLDAARAD